jgi:hypothetical protein
MEYIIGSLVTLATLMLVTWSLRSPNLKEPHKIVYRQSHIFEMIRPFMDIPIYRFPDQNSQSFNHLLSSKQRILYMEDRAYWIRDNALFVSEVVDGVINEEATKVVDTMALDKVELDQLIFIVEKLTEGTDDDGRYPGKS